MKRVQQRLIRHHVYHQHKRNIFVSQQEKENLPSIIDHIAHEVSKNIHGVLSQPLIK